MTGDLNVGPFNLIVDTILLFVDSVSNFVGINTSSPDATLTVDGNVHLGDNNDLVFGDGGDAFIYYDGTNLIVDPDVVGSGDFKVEGDLNITGNFYHSGKVAASKTINFNSSMTRTEIQALIDAEPKYIPSGKTLTFKFADGTYTLDNYLLFAGFYGGGQLLIYGNTSETNATVLHTTQSVHLNFSGTDCYGIYLLRNSVAYTVIRNLKISFYSAANWKSGILINDCSNNINIYYNYLLGNSTSSGQGVQALYSPSIYVYRNYFSNSSRAMLSHYLSAISSRENDDTGTPTVNTLYAHGGILYKISTQPAGGEVEGAGGKIYP